MEQSDKVNFIEWIGNIPNNWHISKIGELYSIKNIKVSDEDYPPLSVTKKGIVPQLENAAKSDAHDDRKLVNKGDFVINSRSDRRGSCGISSLDGSVSLINIVLSPKSNLDSEYFNWLFHTDLFADEFYRWGHGIVDDLWTTNWQNMKNIKIPIPPFDVQQAIATFLNKKCNFIDSLINDEILSHDKLIEYKLSLITESVTKGLNPNVEMKDSNIDWIGEIPEHWKIEPLKRYAKVTKLAGFEFTKYIKYIPEGEIIALRALNIKNNKLNLTNIVKISKEVSDKLIRSKLFKDDLIFTYIGAKTGAVALIDKDDAYHLAPNIAKITNISKNRLYTKFLFYNIMSHHEQEEIWLKISKTGQETITMEKIRTLSLIIPPLNEQKEIVNYLDEKCTLIDSLISEKEQIINKLEEYKKSLIFEYVTGKKEVPK